LLEERLRFERLLSEISAGLIHVAASDLDVALERALQQIVAFLGVDRANVDEYAGDVLRARISWALPGLEEPPEVLDAAQFPWAAGKLRRGEVVRSLESMNFRQRRRSIGQATSAWARARRYRSRCAPADPCWACSPSAPFVVDGPGRTSWWSDSVS
jgi:hypothetical protein